MNPIAQDLNSILARPEVRVAYSLHEPVAGKTVAAFASDDPQRVANVIGEWVRHIEQGCVAIIWADGLPDVSCGREG